LDAVNLRERNGVAIKIVEPVHQPQPGIHVSIDTWIVWQKHLHGHDPSVKLLHEGDLSRIGLGLRAGVITKLLLLLENLLVEEAVLSRCCRLLTVLMSVIFAV
jgi:hypothetical protein